MIINSALILISGILSALILSLEDWRWRLAGLSVVQLISFILIVQIWPIALASVKLISGWMGASLLGTAMISGNQEDEIHFVLSRNVFRLVLMMFGWVVTAISAPIINEWLPISFTNLTIGFLFILCGIFMFALNRTSSQILIGLLIFLSGFDIIYSSLEGSALVTGIYGLIVILISLVGVYLQGGFSLQGER